MKLSLTQKSPKRGFTLVELLVVIAIIASLAGLSYGPIMKHLRSADVLKVQKVCKDLVGSIDLYVSEYDSLPYTGSYPTTDELVTTDTSAFLDVLMGVDTDINDRGKEFFTADQAKSGKSGLVYNGTTLNSLVDKWANPYYIVLDYDADGEIDATLLGLGAEDPKYPTTLRIDSAIAASPGPDGQFDNVSDARSW
jgi:prepilin-type N-terminal cleavage/methylation domain-containing protein